MKQRSVLLPPGLAARLQEKLGPAIREGDESLSLMVAREDLLYVWSRRSGALLVLQPGAGLLQTVSLTAGPQHDVSCLEVNRAGTWAAVWGSQGVTVVQLPRRSRREEVTATSLQVVRGEVQGVSWHPGSAQDCHLAVLTRDARISLYNVSDGHGEVRGLSLASPGRVSLALGEVPVDLAFGQPGCEGQWPLYVLFGSCSVFLVSAAISHEWSVEGPLEVRPAREDNYSGEGCSLAVVGGVLAVATMGGSIYHSVLLGGSTTALHTYEQVELELGQLPSESSSSVFSCPVRLSSESGGSGYLASHRAGLHRVELPMVGLLQEEELPDLTLAGSLVEHLVCTRASSSLPPAPVLGCCSARPPATILCLLADHSLTALPCAPPSAPAPPLSSSPSTLPPPPSTTELDSRISSILARSSTQPLLRSGAGPDTKLPPAEALELLTGATATLRREYLARLHVAREEVARAAARMRERRRGQEGGLARLEEERAQLRDAAEALSERYEDVKDRGSELRGRVEAVLGKLQARVPQMSDKELAMAREVTGLERRVGSLQATVTQLREKERYQRCQVEGGREGRRELGQAQQDNFREVLQSDSKSIAELVKRINAAKKELGM